MKNNIKFSIIIPNYNKEEYVSDTLNSIINQTYKNFEIIIIDDGSTDNSLEIIKKFDNIKLFTTNRRRAGGARNKGLDNATGDYIIFLDSDDFFTNNTVLEKLANLINNEDIIFLNYTRDKFGDVFLIEEEHEDISLKIENTKNLGCPTKCFKKELIDNIRFPEAKRYEDINFALEAMCKAKNVTSSITEEAMIDILEELVHMYRLCIKYPQYKINILNRIKRDKLNTRLDILNHLIEFDENKFFDYFK